jgi:hypothetical protein
MASQRISIAKLAGASAAIVAARMRKWSAARLTDDPVHWCSAQWPQPVRQEAEEFAALLRANALAPPVVYFVEWFDPWSMGDTVSTWLTPTDGPAPLGVFTDGCELFAHELPDGGRLDRFLALAGAQQFSESMFCIGRLREALAAWETLTDQSVVLVVRTVVGPTVLDEEVSASISTVASWCVG